MSNVLWGIGRNYLDHAAEMKAETPSQPMVFLKSYACLTTTSPLRLPPFSKEIHHEIELAVELGENFQPHRVALALDLTARDHQQIAKQKGEPWSLAKSFIGACPISPWIEFKGFSWFNQLSFELKINQQLRQKGQAQNMIFKLPALIEHLKTHFPVKSGDIILTGTPAGVGPLKSKDKIEAKMEDQIFWSLEVL